MSIVIETNPVLTGQKSHILIVDDREFDRLLYKEYLSDERYKYSELDDGYSILETLENIEANLILLDWQMPKRGGLETLQAIKSRPEYSNIPIIIITGLKDEKVLKKAFDFGGIDFINKPVSNIELNSRVTNALALSNANQKLRQNNKELEQLNQIITEQKTELQKSISLKMELAALKEEKFENELIAKKKELIGLELNSTKTKDRLNAFAEGYKELQGLLRKSKVDHTVQKAYDRIGRLLNDIIDDQDSWEHFKATFESVEPTFYKDLMAINPKLTSLDLKHCTYIRMNLDNHEVSKILNVEMKSLQMTRYRLKKKLSLGEDKSLHEFILSI